MWTFHLDLNEVMVRKGGKMQLSRVVQRSLFELDRLDEACQKSERYSFFRNTLNKIVSFKAVSILENCGKQQKVYAKVRTSGVAEGYKPCSSQMSY